MRAFWKYFEWSFKVHKNSGHAIDNIVHKYVKEMMRSGNVVSCHGGLILFETVYEKRGGLTEFASADWEKEEFD